VSERPYAQDGSVYLFSFKESRGADMARFENEKTALVEQALQEKKQATARKFIETLKAKARIEVEPTILEGN
jgi:hypothetical protein